LKSGSGLNFLFFPTIRYPFRLSLIPTCNHNKYIYREREKGRGERERERERERPMWHYIVGLTARGKLGGQSFDGLFGKQAHAFTHKL